MSAVKSMVFTFTATCRFDDIRAEVDHETIAGSIDELAEQIKETLLHECTAVENVTINAWTLE